MFSCDVCQKKFSQKVNLKTHIRIHTGEKPFKCDICEKSFSQGGGLTAHMRFHTGKKPYSCDTCENAFRTISELSRHKRIHTGEKPYSCDTCFVDCGEADVKLEIKEEETLDEDPLSINIEAENVEETIKQEIEEEGQDQDFFSCEQNPGEDRSRVGGSDLTTMICPGRGMASFSIDGQPMYNNRKTQSSSDITLINAFRTISNMADRINSTKTIQDRANNLFKMVHDGKNLKGRSNDAIVATCLYIACRQEGVPRTFNEIVAVSTVSKKEIGRCFKLILKAHDTSVELITTGDFMSRFCCTLNLPRDVQKAATHIAKKAVDLDIVPGRSPISVAAAAIYMASQASDDKRTHRDIAEITGVADVTIRQSYKLMLPKAKDLFPADFKFTTPIENLPHN